MEEFDFDIANLHTALKRFRVYFNEFSASSKVALVSNLMKNLHNLGVVFTGKHGRRVGRIDPPMQSMNRSLLA